MQESRINVVKKREIWENLEANTAWGRALRTDEESYSTPIRMAENF